MAISDDERARIEEEEILRHKLREAMVRPKPTSFWASLKAPENLKWIVASLMVPLATAIWGVFDGIQQRAERQQQAAIAEARRDVDQMTALIPNLTSDKPAERAIGLAILSTLVNTDQATPSMKAAFAQIQAAVTAGRSSTDSAVRVGAALDAESIYRGSVAAGQASSSASVGGAQAAAAAPTVTGQASKTVLPAYVYIQLYRFADAADAAKLREALRQRGVAVPGVENVVSTQGRRMLVNGQIGAIDVRYFRGADKDAALNLANAIAAVLPERGAPTVRAVSGLGGKVRPGLVEVWFPCGASRRDCLLI